MKPNYYNNVTTTYKYNSHEEEFVFCYKNRPFVILSSSFFPVPNCSYIDHHLIMELGMKMSDVGCKKICFAGKKLRMLGKVSFTAQCVKDGGVFGNFHVKATVIEDLKGSLQKKKIKSVDFFHPSRAPPPSPPLKCGNTFFGGKFFLQFFPGNDLPTHKNWMK